jgi:hypothetical protein
MSNRRADDQTAEAGIDAQNSGMDALFLMPVQAIVSAPPIKERQSPKRRPWPESCAPDQPERRASALLRSALKRINQQLVPKGEPS